jgi:hypothetical protein
MDWDLLLARRLAAYSAPVESKERRRVNVTVVGTPFMF